jgi:DNA-binding NtrC family response regulator
VDDDPIGRELLIEHFQGRGYVVEAVHDGRAAVNLIQRQPARFGLVLTDLHLPGADGLEVLRAAKHANPSCYVVIITGYASLDSAIQAVRLGAYDYLTKPFALGQLDVVEQRIADRLALEAENRQLARQVGERDLVDARGVMGRLDAIDARLARIEAALRESAGRKTT